jgi:hypothetical protein
MSQVLFGAATTPQLTDLDANFTEVYGRTQLMTSSGTSAGFGGNAGASTGSVTPKLWAQNTASAVALGAFQNDGTNNLRVSLFADSTNGYVGLDADRTTGLIGYSFRIGGTERLRLDTSGVLYVASTAGWTAATSAMNVHYAGAATAFGLSINTAATTGRAINFLQGGASTGGAATSVGSITITTSATAYNTSSDYRLKEDVRPIANSGAFIDALKPCTWAWKTDGSAGSGFIAHELQAVSPTSVVGSKDAVDAEGAPIYQAVEYGSAEVIAMMVAELKALRLRVAALGG